MQGLIAAKTSVALDRGPFEAALEFSSALLAADGYLLLSSVSAALAGLLDAAWLLTELKTETVTCLVGLVNLQLETSLAVLMMDQLTGSLWTDC